MTNPIEEINEAAKIVTDWLEIGHFHTNHANILRKLIAASELLQHQQTKLTEQDKLLGVMVNGLTHQRDLINKVYAGEIDAKQAFGSIIGTSSQLIVQYQSYKGRE